MVKDNISFAAQLHAALARLESDPTTSEEWEAIRGALASALEYAKRQRDRYADRFKMTPKGHPAEDPRRAQCCFDWNGRHLLGDVTDVYFDDVAGTFRLKVKHFNGEPWPIDPPMRSVTVLRR